MNNLMFSSFKIAMGVGAAYFLCQFITFLITII